VSAIDPANTTVGDLATEVLRESGWLGQGQDAQAADIAATQTRLQWMLQQWQRERWLVYVLDTLVLPSTGANSYSIGPGGVFDTGANSVRPDKVEAAFLRQITQSQPNQIDYPLEIIQSQEDYDRIALKQLKSFPGAVYLKTSWPLGEVFLYPVAQANIYAIGLSIKTQLPGNFFAQAGLATKLSLPWEYYAAILYEGATRMRSYFRIPTPPGDPLPGLTRNALGVLRGANTQIARLVLPKELVRGPGGLYNIFSDRTY
jgi:hypothetical protein